MSLNTCRWVVCMVNVFLYCTAVIYR